MSETPEELHFVDRHIGPDPADVAEMLRTIGKSTLDELIRATVPAAILRDRARPLDLPAPRSEAQALDDLRAMAASNAPLRPMIGMGYHDTITPPVIQRNILENPAWYTAYTPYQPEIAQGRLEALINFQTAICDLTGMEIANASLLDEGSAAAEAIDARPQRLDRARRERGPRRRRHPSPDDRRRAYPRRAPGHRGRGRAAGRAPRPCRRAAGGRASVRDPPLQPGLVRAPSARSAPRSRPRMRRTSSSSWRRIRWRPSCSRAPVPRAPTSSSGAASASASRWATAVRTPPSSRRAPRSGARCRAAWWACPWTRTARRRTGSRSRRGSSTFAARRRPRTSAPPRSSWP